MVWSTWRGLWYSLKYTAMKIRFQSFLDGESGNGEINWHFFKMQVWEREAGMPKLLYMWSLAWDLIYWKKSYSKKHATVRSKIRFCFGLPIIVLSLYISWQLKRRLFVYTEPALKNGPGGEKKPLYFVEGIKDNPDYYLPFLYKKYSVVEFPLSINWYF